MDLYFLKRDVTGLTSVDMYKGIILSYQKVDKEFVVNYAINNIQNTLDTNKSMLYNIICRYGAVGLENGDFFIDMNRNSTGSFSEVKGRLLSLMRDEVIDKMI